MRAYPLIGTVASTASSTSLRCGSSGPAFALARSRHTPRYGNITRAYGSSSFNPTSAPLHGASGTSGRTVGLASLSLLLAIYLASPLRADAKEEEGKKGKSAFTKEQLGIICVIGGPGAGKSTQIENIKKRFNLKQVSPLSASQGDEKLKSTLQDLVSSGSSNDKKPRVIIEDWPSTVEESGDFEKKYLPILLFIFIDLDAEKALARISDEKQKSAAQAQWSKFKKESAGLIKKYRLQGNILEITGEWPKDEVWEQVEAKLESALELDDRGEL